MYERKNIARIDVPESRDIKQIVIIWQCTSHLSTRTFDWISSFDTLLLQCLQYIIDWPPKDSVPGSS